MKIEISGEDYTNILVALERYQKYIQISDDQPDKLKELEDLYDRLYSNTEPITLITINR